MSRYQQPRAPCLHCHRVLSVQSRGLCKRCFNNVYIRMHYSPLVSVRRDAAPMDATLLHQPVPDRCVHDRPDGLCPECEKKQREEMEVI